MNDLFATEQEILDKAMLYAETLKDQYFSELVNAYAGVLKQLRLSTKMSDRTLKKIKELEQLHKEAQERELALKLREEQIKTVMAMAVTANHEINQHLAYMSLAYDLIKAKNNIADMPEKERKHWDKISEAIQSIAKLLTKYKTQNSNFSFQTYLENDQMINFGESE